MIRSLGVIGCGNMGAAILRGLAGRSDLSLFAVDADTAKTDELREACGVTPVAGVKELAEVADCLILAVKPNQVQSVLHELAPRLRPAQVLVSIAAGVPLAKLKDASSGVCPLVRVMPNTPVKVQSGVFALCLEDPELTPDQREFVIMLFSGLGQVHVLPEKYFDAFTALVGCGPAYVYYFMEALVEAAVVMGLARNEATRMVVALFEGSTRLAKEDGRHLSLLREMVTSPAGSTIAATSLLDSLAVRGSIIEAVRAACQRNKELGEE